MTSAFRLRTIPERLRYIADWLAKSRDPKLMGFAVTLRMAAEELERDD